MTTPHKHQATINAWAAGAQIQWRMHDRAVWEDADYPAWSPNYQYRVKNPHQALIDAHKAGDLIEVDHGAYWSVVFEPDWRPGSIYRISPRSAELKELIAAHKAGVPIEMKTNSGSSWQSCRAPVWVAHVEYRIKDKFADLRKAFSEGKLIEAFDTDLEQFRVNLRPLWDESVEYRLCPRQDELKPVIEAHLKGKQIEFRQGGYGDWCECVCPPRWWASHDYRIKPRWPEELDAYLKGEVIQSGGSGVWYDQNRSPELEQELRDGRLGMKVRIKHKHQDCIDAYERGEAVQCNNSDGSGKWLTFDNAVDKPPWLEDLSYRIKPKHKHQAVIDAYEAGETVQCQLGDGTWHDHKKGVGRERPCFSESWEYRIKQPHQEVRDAFAEGKAVQWHGPGSIVWKDTVSPTWGANLTYRIRPEPLKSRRFVWTNYGKQQVGICNPTNHHDVPASSFVRWIDDDWVETGV